MQTIWYEPTQDDITTYLSFDNNQKAEIDRVINENRRRYPFDYRETDQKVKQSYDPRQVIDPVAGGKSKPRRYTKRRKYKSKASTKKKRRGSKKRAGKK